MTKVVILRGEYVKVKLPGIMVEKQTIISGNMKKKEGANPPYTLRIPPQLRELLERAAGAKSHSLNAEVIARLWASFEETSASENRIEALENRVQALEEELAALKKRT